MIDGMAQGAVAGVADVDREVRPLVLVCAGNDPSGGAGLAADSAALLSQGCFPCPVVTALTVQDTRRLSVLDPVAAPLVEAQARAVFEDLPIAMVKIGVIGDADNAAAIARVLDDYPTVPVVLDPVLRAGGGGELAAIGLEQVLLQRLLPRTLVMTPNAAEARRLVPPAGSPAEQAAALRALGCDYVLLTRADEPTGSEGGVINTLYGPDGLEESTEWQRLPGSYHGSGCTMASALAGLLARGMDMRNAVVEAQAFTWQALRNGLGGGHGQQLPDRLFWAAHRFSE